MHLQALYGVAEASQHSGHLGRESSEFGEPHDGGNRHTDHCHHCLGRFRTAMKVSFCVAPARQLEGTYLEARLQRTVPSGNTTRFPVFIDVLGPAFHTPFHGSVHRSLHVCKRQHRWAIDGGIRLLRLRCLFKEVHRRLEVIFRTPVGCVALLVEDLEEHVILLRHIIWTPGAVFDSRREANVCRRLREIWRVEFVILEVTEDGFRGWNVRLVDLALSSGIDRGLQMEFL